MSNPRKINVALVGNPNAGKSSVFNLLTGLRQKTGNFPGVTVEKKTADIEIGERACKLIDLPGIYSLYPNSLDEKVVLDILLNPNDELYPDLVVYVADYNQIDRHLLLLTQIKDLGFNTFLVLTMTDVGAAPDEKMLGHLGAQLRIPILCANGRTGEGITALQATIEQLLSEPKADDTPFVLLDPKEQVLTQEVAHLRTDITEKDSYRALLLTHHHKQLHFLTTAEKQALSNVVSEQKFESVRFQIAETMRRYDKIEVVMRSIGRVKLRPVSSTERIDRVVTHPIFGFVIFFSVMFAVFQAIFTIAAYPQEWIELALGTSGEWVRKLIGEGWLSSVLVDGLLAGLTGILVFVPQIAILMLLLGLLEECGYMARAVYLFDSTMQRFGLNGRSVVSLIAGGACALPAIMSARTISNQRERLITILVTPLISCSARVPVFALLVSFLFSDSEKLGIFSMQGLVFSALYLLGIFSALISAFVFSKIVKNNDCSFLMLELPNYRKPHWRNLGLNVYQSVRSFIEGAGKTILVISVLLWGLSNYGPKGHMARAAAQAELSAKAQGLSEKDAKLLVSSEQLRHSFAGYLGQGIEPIIKPLGFDWKIGIALITSFAAREVFVGSMNTIYRAGAKDDEYVKIKEHMARDKRADNGQPVFSTATVVSLLLFFVFALQCISTLVLVKKETGTWKWPIVQFLFMGTLAWLSSFLAYQWLS